MYPDTKFQSFCITSRVVPLIFNLSKQEFINEKIPIFLLTELPRSSLFMQQFQVYYRSLSFDHSLQYWYFLSNKIIIGTFRFPNENYPWSNKLHVHNQIQTPFTKSRPLPYCFYKKIRIRTQNKIPGSGQELTQLHRQQKAAKSLDTGITHMIFILVMTWYSIHRTLQGLSNCVDEK